MPIARLSIFTMPFINEIQTLESQLSSQEQRLALVKKQIETLQKALPNITDDNLWKETFRSLEDLQRLELQVNSRRLDIWSKIKSIITERECSQKPECEVIPLRIIQ
jgi:seryl-tRNA synthetase